MMNLSKRAKIRVISFAAAGIVALGGLCYMGWYEAWRYRLGVEYGYQKSFQDLVDTVVAIDTTLQKGSYARSPSMVATLANEISRKAYGAQINIGSLPFALSELESTAKFLAQLGDYAYYLSKQSAEGQPLSNEQIAEMRAMSQTAQYLSSSLTGLLTVANEESMNLGKVLASGAADGQLPDIGGLSQTMKNAEERFTDFPMLIYDGPFSDHIEKRVAEFIKDKPEIDKNEAASCAAEYLDIQPALLQPMSDVAGKIPAYQFKTVLDGGEIFITISKQGGYCLSLISSRNISNPKLSFDDAVRKAQEFLAAHGFDGMKESYYTRSGNMLLINFAYKSDDVVYYTDLIKVGIALDNGKVQIFESAGYVMNHTQRELPESLVTMEQARMSLSPDLFVSSAELCVIPSDGLNEVLCYGFTCVNADSQTYLVYVNVESGYEERILILLEDENGSLTI